MRLFAAALMALTALAPALRAQEVPNTILVMDASGSMWGQIDGVNKIVIAREVVADILADFPADQNLGLTVYGHRTRGDCTDIETLIAPAPGTAPAIIAAVNDINPRGMTPMTDAVIAAAEALRYTEQVATVILVSDGIETCNPDPCAAARALEQAGIGFTAHVIGFDVGSDSEALAQMQCIADETGGQFLTAANAAELTVAVATAIAATPTVAPEPAPVHTILQAVTDAVGAPLVTDPVTWTVTGPDGPVADGQLGNPLDLTLPPASYTATATIPGASAEAAFDLSTATTVTVVFPEPVPAASLTAPDSAPAGSPVEIGWTGPADQFDNLQVGVPGEPGSHSFAYVADGNPLFLIMPPTPGSYELRYAWRDTQVIATRPITVTEAVVALTAPDSAPGGSTVMVGWQGRTRPMTTWK